jgi:hypothetical protein
MATGIIFGILTPEDGTDMLTRNIAKQLQLLVTSQPTRAHFPSPFLRKLELTSDILLFEIQKR